MNHKEKKAVGIIMIATGSFFLFLGILFAAVFIGISSIMNHAKDKKHAEFIEFSKNAVETTGEVVGVDDGMTTISYYVQDEEIFYQIEFNVSNSSYPEGTGIIAYYDKENPGICMVPELVERTYEVLNKIFFLVGCGIGIAFAMIGLLLLIIGIVLHKKKAVPVCQS